MRQCCLPISIIFLTLNFGTAYAHQDFWIVKDYGNIKIRVKSGFDYEEINKVFIIGQLAEIMAKDLAYSKQVFFDFNHYYVGDCKPDYFISYDNGQIKYSWSDNSRKELVKGKALVIRQVARKFDVIGTLKLFEYAIKNRESIKSSQKTIHYDQNYCDWTINSIDTVLIEKQLTQDSSPLLLKTIDARIERPEKDFHGGVSYYWHKEKFFVFLRKKGLRDSVVLEMSSIYNLQRVEPKTILIFDSDHSFYCITTGTKLRISRHHEILNTFNYYQPYRVKMTEKDKLSINFNDFQTGLRTLMYSTASDELKEEFNKK